MDVWDVYQQRMDNFGGSLRGAALRREQNFINSKLPNSLSYFDVLIDNESRNVAIINSDNYDEKTIISLPGENIDIGSYVEWMDNIWLVSDRDANSEIYTKAKMLQCNYLLKWIDTDSDGNPQINEQWCVIDDGTKYMTGDYVDRDFIVTRGDMRIAMTIRRDEHTIKFNRKSRFLIDDDDSEEKYAFALTKPLKVGHTYNGKGVLMFVLSETNSTDYDNFELSIPDYYKYYPSQGNSEEDSDDEEVWI